MAYVDLCSLLAHRSVKSWRAREKVYFNLSLQCFISLLDSGFWSIDCFLCSNANSNAESPFPLPPLCTILLRLFILRDPFGWPEAELDEATNLMENQVPSLPAASGLWCCFLSSPMHSCASRVPR